MSIDKFRSSARVSACERSCYAIRLLQLYVINFIDLSLGLSFLAFTTYLYTKLGSDFTDKDVAWVGWCTGALGILLFIVSMLSLMAVLTPGCRCSMVPSNYLAIVVFIYIVGLAVASIAKQEQFFDYLNHTDLSDNEVQTIKHWYTAISFTLLGMSIIEIWRLLLSLNFRDQALRVDTEFKQLLLEEERAYEEKSAANKDARESKYKDLREHYRLKYSSPN